MPDPYTAAVTISRYWLGLHISLVEYERDMYVEDWVNYFFDNRFAMPSSSC